MYDDITVTLGKYIPITMYHLKSVLILKYPGDHDVTDRYETKLHTSKAVELEIEKHPRFYIRRGLGVIKYDIAILTLEQPVDFSQFPHIRQDIKQFRME